MKPSGTFTLEILFSFSQSFTLTGCNCSPSGHADNETTCFPYCSGHWEPDPHHPHLVHSQPPGQNQFHIFMMYKLFVTLTPEPILSKLFDFFCASIVLFKFSEFVSIFSLPSQIYWSLAKPISWFNQDYPRVKHKWSIITNWNSIFNKKNGRSKSISWKYNSKFCILDL